LIVDAWFSLGRAESKLGRRDIALAHFERARALASRFEEDELVAEKLAVLVAIVKENGEAYYARPERPEAASFVHAAREAADEILAVHARRRGTPFMDDLARVHEYTALASAAEMSYERAARAGTAAMDELEHAGRYLTTALGLFDRPAISVACARQEMRHGLLYSAGSVACRAGQRERARELLGEALAPAAGCEPDRARALTEKIEKYIRDESLADECLPAAAARMFEEPRDIHDGNRTNRTNRESNPHAPDP
jgi:tetratricopeptide (TPR) repeat protein